MVQFLVQRIAVASTIGELDQEGSANGNVRVAYNPGLTEKAGEGSGLVVACVPLTEKGGNEMKKILLSVLAAATLMALSTAPSSAWPCYRHYHHWHHCCCCR